MKLIIKKSGASTRNSRRQINIAKPLLSDRFAAVSNKVKKSKHKILFSLLTLIAIAFIALIANIIYCYNTIVISNYELSANKLNTSLRIALISDLHLKEYGKDNIDLVNKIKEQSPDIIILAGDFTLRYSTDYSSLLKLLPQLNEIAPTYYSLGNHEIYLLEDTDFEKDVRKTGVHLLINQSEYFEKDGEKILIGGLKTYPFFGGYTEKNTSEEKVYFKEFLKQEKDCYGILICHYPEYYMWKLSEYDIDLMLSGHTHGGLIRIPGIGGLVAPEQGFFPKYDKGLYKSDTATMIITSGLSNSNFVPRINNPGEICIININSNTAQ